MVDYLGNEKQIVFPFSKVSSQVIILMSYFFNVTFKTHWRNFKGGLENKKSLYSSGDVEPFIFSKFENMILKF
jgi:hypothetical protein